MKRGDFIDLYKYGFYYLNKDRIVPFEGNVFDLSKRSDIFDELFSEVNSFESPFAYLLLHFVKNEEGNNRGFVSIEEVRHIFPLNDDAKREFETSFDEHIRIEAPIWDDAVSLIQKRLLFSSSMQGVRNVFSVFKLKNLQSCKSFVDDNMVEEMLSDVYDNRRPSGNKSIWVYLMMYERHSYYPKDTLGFYMDIVHIICNYMAKREVEDYEVEGTSIYKTLESYSGLNLKSNEINDRLRQDERASSFLLKISEFVPQIDFISVAINYLVMRERFSDDFTYDQEFIERCKVSFGQSFTLAAYMIGIALTHDKTYSCLYENLPLPIYKSQAEMQRIKMQKEYEKEKAKCEMQRMEEERERERMMRRESSRSNGRKKKKTSYNHYDKSSYPYNATSNGYGYSRQYDGDYSPFQEQEQPTYKFPFHEDASNIAKEPDQSDKELTNDKVKSPSLFSTDVMDEIEKESWKLISFPLTMQKYTPSGKPSKAKGSIKVVNNKEEYWLLKTSNEVWRIKK